MKKINTVQQFIVLFLMVAVVGACSTKQKGFNPWPKVNLGTLPVVKANRDTIPTKKVLTQQERQDLINTYYKFYYDKYFAPEFGRLRDIIQDQAKSNARQSNSVKNLSDIILSMRTRAIKRNDSLANIISSYQTEIIKLKKAELERDRKQIENNKRQIDSTNKLVKYLMVGFIVIFVLVVLGYIFGYLYYISLKAQLKNIKNA